MDSLCRLCLVHVTKGTDLFKKHSSQEYLKQLKEMFQVELKDIPGWPRTACNRCVEKLKWIKEFKAGINSSHEKLFQLVSDIRIKCERVEYEETTDGALGGTSYVLEEDPVDIKCEPEDYEDPFDDNWSIHEEDLADPNNVEIISEVFKEEVDYGDEKDPSSSDDDSSDEDDRTNSVPNKTTGQKKIRRILPEDEKFEKMLRDMKVLKCQPCKMEFSSFTKLYQHQKTAHNKHYGTIICCGLQFKEQSGAYDHMKYHLDKDSFKCEECGKCCLSDFKLNIHKNNVHVEITGAFKCGKCGKAFKSKDLLNQHLLFHISPKKRRFKCPQCDKRFNRKLDINIHLKSIHEKTKRRRTECEICGDVVIFLNAHNKWKHPSSDDIKICSVCGKKMSKLSLRQHMKNFHSEERFPCTTLKNQDAE